MSGGAFRGDIAAAGPPAVALRMFVGGPPAADDPDGAVQKFIKSQQGKVVGLIDGGLAFAHANFLRAGKTRVRHFWRQDAQGAGPAPEGLGYGHALTGAQIDHAMQAHTYGGLVDETAVYAHFKLGMEINKRRSHATHVLDIACGPRTVLAQILDYARS